MKSTNHPAVIPAPPTRHAAWCGYSEDDHRPTECLAADTLPVLGTNDCWNEEPWQRSVDIAGWKTSLRLGVGRDDESPDGYHFDVLPGVSDGTQWSEEGQHVQLTLAGARELRDHLIALIAMAEADQAEVTR